MKKTAFLLLALFVMVGSVSGVYLSSTPSNIDLGTVEPGSTHELSFYLDTDAQTPFEIRPEAESLGISTMRRTVPEDNISEQDVSNWISFTQRSFTIDPSTSQEYELINGQRTNAQGLYTLRLNVPPRGEAEPGYHMVELRPNAQFSNTGSGFGTTSVALAIPSLTFQVDGDVRREIQATDAEALRIGENRVQIVLQFTNTGTVTTSYRGGRLNIYREDRKVGEVYIRGFEIAPGESIETDAVWNSGDLGGGVYRIEGAMSYWSGQFYVEEDISFTNTPQTRRQVDEPEPENEDEGDDFPTWLFLLFLVALASVMYTFEFELFWIVMTVGAVALAGVILLSSASNYLLLLLLTSLVAIIYYGGI